VIQIAKSRRRSDWGDLPAGRREIRKLVRVRVVPGASVKAATPPDGRVQAVCQLINLRPQELGCGPSRSQSKQAKRLRRRRALAAHLLVGLNFSTIELTHTLGFSSHASVLDLLAEVRRTPEVIALEEALRTLLGDRWMYRAEALVLDAERALWPLQMSRTDVHA
jgi:hypothetical protein